MITLEIRMMGWPYFIYLNDDGEKDDQLQACNEADHT